MATQAEHSSTNRRDFLYVATGAVGAVGAAAVVWPLINQLNPDASTLALASIEFDVAAIPEGQSVTITWRGLPVFVRHRTAAEIEEARAAFLPIDDVAERHGMRIYALDLTRDGAALWADTRKARLKRR